jgi:hypothetical protein
MIYLGNALTVWIAPSGVIPGVLLFELVSVGTAWAIVIGLLASVCGFLWVVTVPSAFLRTRRSAWLGRRRRLHVVPVRSKRSPEPQHA